MNNRRKSSLLFLGMFLVCALLTLYLWVSENKHDITTTKKTDFGYNTTEITQFGYSENELKVDYNKLGYGNVVELRD